MKNTITVQQLPDLAISSNLVIKHLNPGELTEKEKTISLYKEVFPEDSKDYVRYYYDWKGQENEILILENHDSSDRLVQVCAMLHLNPYEMWISTQSKVLHYIVAVATALPYRRQGCMRILMQQAFEWLYHQEEPFTYLMPADTVYYESFGFRVIYDQIPVSFPDDVESANIYAKENFDVVTLRNKRYLDFLASEPKESEPEESKRTESMPGKTEFVEETEEKNHDTNSKKEVSAVGCEWKPQIMCRIIHVAGLLECLRAEQPTNICLHVQDPWIAENTGWYHWLIDKDSSVVKPLSDRNNFKENFIKDCLHISIEDLTEQLFGAAPLHPLLKKIRILKRICINEEV